MTTNGVGMEGDKDGVLHGAQEGVLMSLYAFLCHFSGATFIAKYSEASVEKTVDALNDHRIIVFTRKDMDVDS